MMFESQRSARTQPWSPPFRIPLTVLIVITVFLVLDSSLDAPLMMNDLSWRERTAEMVETGSRARQVGFLLLGSIGVVSLLNPKKPKARPHGAAGIAAIVLIAFTFLSVFWSDAPTLTIKRLFVLFMLTFPGFAIVRFQPTEWIMRMTFIYSGVTILSGFILEYHLGTFRPWDPTFRFAGLAHPNYTGLVLALFLLVIVAWGGGTNRKRFVYYVLYFCGFILLIFTKSRTAFASFLVAYLATQLLKSKRGKIFRIAFIGSILLLVIVIILGDAIFPLLAQGILLGRVEDNVSSFAGRRGIWSDCLKFISERPILGYGYSGFWTPEHIEIISNSQGWGISSSHSVYLEILLSLGSFGLVLYLIFLVTAIAKTRQKSAKTLEPSSIFLYSVLVLYTFHGLLEGLTINPSFPLLLFLCIAIEVGFSFHNTNESRENVSKQRPQSRVTSR